MYQPTKEGEARDLKTIVLGDRKKRKKKRKGKRVKKKLIKRNFSFFFKEKK